MSENFTRGAGSAGAGEPRSGALPYPRRINEWTPQVFDRARVETRRAGVTINSLNAYLVADVIISDALVGENIMDPRLAQDRAYAIGEIRRFFRLNFVLPSEVSAADAVTYLREHQKSVQESLTRTQRDTFPDLLAALDIVATNPDEIEAQLIEAQQTLASTTVDTTPRRDAMTTEELFDLVSEASIGTAIIHTNLPEGQSITSIDGNRRSISGSQTFGDGSFGKTNEVPNHLYTPIGAYNPITTVDGSYVYPIDMVEAVAFMPVVGERRVRVTHPRTGNTEEAIYFDYAYNPRLTGDPSRERELGLPIYRETQGNRSGNSFIVRIILPQSIAVQLQEEIERRPVSAREIAEKMVLERGGVSEEQWFSGISVDIYGRTVKCNRSKPPYEGLQGDHRMYLVTPSQLPLDATHFSRPPVARKIEMPVY